MRRVIDGNGNDSTAAVVAWLSANNELWLRNLYLIGDPDDPAALRLTDHESPLVWSAWGTFYPGVVKRDKVVSKIGTEVADMSLQWTPPYAFYPATTGIGGSPYVRARLGLFDNAPFRCWTCYMPMPGDADTFGASELFGGRIARSAFERGVIRFTVNSFLDVVNQSVPLNVIEITNTRAAYKAATPPAGLSRVPQFSVGVGSNTKFVLGYATSPTPGQIFATNAFQFGYLVFNRGTGTLGGVWSAIQSNLEYISGVDSFNGFTLYSALPWAPEPESDTFYVSAAFPVNQADGEYVGFPYVPSPESAVGA